MLSIRTAQGYTLPVNWIGVCDYDRSLRFETPSTDLAVLFQVFSDPGQTSVITRILNTAGDIDEREYNGFTVFKGIELMPDERTGNRNTVIRLLPGNPEAA